jgi:pilus assembly protein CpaE
VESVWLEAESPRYEFFTDVVRQSNSDVAIVALDSDQAKALQLIAQLTQEFPAVPILAVSAKGDGQLILQALRAGAKEFLTQPVVLEELLLALSRLRQNRGSANGMSNGSPVRNDSQVIAVAGSRGGVGCTSIAVNLGTTLAQDKNNSVALIDLDLALGDADVALDLTPDYTLADVALNVDRLDMTFLRRSLSKHATGLSLLPHPVQMEDIAMIHEDHLQRLLGLLRASYTHLILDLSKRFTPMDLMAMRAADVILLVAQLELTSLRNVVRLMLALTAEDGMADKTKIIINRVGSELTDASISIRKAEDTIGRPIFWEVPNDTKSMMASRNNGEPLIQFAPRSKLQQSFVGLIDALSNKKNGQAAPKKEKKSFFSFT